MSPSIFILLFSLHTIFGLNTNEGSPEQCVQDWVSKFRDLEKRFNRDQLKIMCQRNIDWAEAATSPAAPVSDFLTPLQLAYLSKLRNCQGSDCLKLLNDDQDDSNPTDIPILKFNVTQIAMNILRGTKGGKSRTRQGFPPGRVTRKEYRAMTDKERHGYHEAIRRLKADKIDGLSKYDLLVIYHTPQEAPEAHWGPAFLPYHREFLKQFELALRQVDPTVSLAYWDSTLDEGLPNPADSILWTREFFGTAEGPVFDGPFAGWTTAQELSNVPGERRLTRQVGVSPYGGLYKPSDIDFIMSRSRFDDLTQCVDPTFELTHGVVHSFVGGHMLEIPISPNDPVFFSHHGFVDYLWEQFRQTKQSAQQRQRDYPPFEYDCSEFHYANAYMKPFSIRNVDGLSDRYTSELYQYEQRPVCSGSDASCAPSSPYLFCDIRKNRCLSKIRMNGNCTGFENQAICYDGVCRDGRCVLSDVPEIIISGGGAKTTTDNPTSTRPYYPIQTYNVTVPSPIYRPSVLTPEPPPKPCGCTQKPVAYITITVVKGYGYGYSAQHAMDAIVQSVGLGSPVGYEYAYAGRVWPNVTAPSYVGACVLPVYNPNQTDQAVRFSVIAKIAMGRQCNVQCWDDGRHQYGNCPNGASFAISSNTQFNSDPIPFFQTENEALEKRWIGSGYRRYRLPDYVFFKCL